MPRPEDYPNQPDVDVRDAFTEYIVDVDIPEESARYQRDPDN